MIDGLRRRRDDQLHSHSEQVRIAVEGQAIGDEDPFPICRAAVVIPGDAAEVLPGPHDMKEALCIESGSSDFGSIYSA